MRRVEKTLETTDDLVRIANQHEMLIQAVVDYAIFMIDPEGRVVNWNTGAERIKGYGASEIIGQHFSRFYLQEDIEAGLPGIALATARLKGRYEAEGWRKRKDESLFWVSVVVDAIYHHGNLVGFAKVTRDLTERHEAQQQLFQLQKMEAVGQLSGGLAHDFNNLLAAISVSLELMKKRIEQGRTMDLHRYIATAEGAASRAAALTQRLLAFSRRQTLVPKRTDPNQLIAGMADLLRGAVGQEIALKTVLAPDCGSTLCDSNQLESAILNLCINARDAMPHGGQITIETTHAMLDEHAAQVRDVQPGPFVVIRVGDTGVGMPPGVLERAFEPFFTTKPIGQGTGLGLAMIYGFTKQSGGHADLESQAGAGTEVLLYLPQLLAVADDAEVSPARPTEAMPMEHRHKTFLLVDDEPTVRLLVTEVLVELGYDVIQAADGPSGLKVLQSDTGIDLLITDVGLPGGMNGRQVADAARLSRPELPVLFITGYAETCAIRSDHLEPGMHVMAKPFTMGAISSRVLTIIAEAEGQRTLSAG